MSQQEYKYHDPKLQINAICDALQLDIKNDFDKYILELISEYGIPSPDKQWSEFEKSFPRYEIIIVDEIASKIIEITYHTPLYRSVNLFNLSYADADAVQFNHLHIHYKFNKFKGYPELGKIRHVCGDLVAKQPHTCSRMARYDQHVMRFSEKLDYWGDGICPDIKIAWSSCTNYYRYYQIREFTKIQKKYIIELSLREQVTKVDNFNG